MCISHDHATNYRWPHVVAVVSLEDRWSSVLGGVGSCINFVCCIVFTPRVWNKIQPPDSGIIWITYCLVKCSVVITIIHPIHSFIAVKACVLLPLLRQVCLSAVMWPYHDNVRRLECNEIWRLADFFNLSFAARGLVQSQSCSRNCLNF
jgi:hypothetical protein